MNSTITTSYGRSKIHFFLEFQLSCEINKVKKRNIYKKGERVKLALEMDFGAWEIFGD